MAFALHRNPQNRKDKSKRLFAIGMSNVQTRPLKFTPTRRFIYLGHAALCSVPLW